MKNPKTTDYWYDATAARIMSGVAILLMIAHHFFCFPDYLLPGVSWISLGSIAGIEVERIVGAFGKICVSVFAFNSGYVLFVKNLPPPYMKGYSGLIYSLIPVRILHFLIKYWIVYILFLFYALCIGDQLPDWHGFLWNLFGLKTGPHVAWVNVPFAWYVAYYVSFLFLRKWIVAFFSSRKVIKDIARLLGVFVILQIVCKFGYVDFLSPLFVSIVGYLSAKWKIFEQLDSYFGKFPLFLYGLMILGVVICRQGSILLCKETSWVSICSLGEMIWVVVFIYSILSLLSISSPFGRWILFMLKNLGKYSMNMWFIHGIFFTGCCYLQSYIYDFHYSPLIFSIGVILSLILSLIVGRIQSLLLVKF